MASDIRIFSVLSTLLIVLLSLKLCENRKLELSLNARRAMHHLSPYFLSISLDPSLLVDESTGEFSEDRIDFVKAVNMAKGLSPAFLRVGGPSTDSKMFRFEAFPFECGDDSSSSNNSSENCDIDRKKQQYVTFSGAQLMLLSHFAEEAGLKTVLCLGYDLNKQGKHNRKVTQDVFGYKVEKQDNWDAWDSKQALDIIRFADSMEISLGYQMGYEVDYLKAANKLRNKLDESDEPTESQNSEGEKDFLVGKIAEEEALRAGAALSRDIIRLRILLDAFPRSRGSLLLSPGICLPTALSGHRTQLSANSNQLEPHASRKLSAFLHAFLHTSEKAITALVWHPSSFSGEWNEHGAISTARNSDAAFHEKDSLSKILGRAIAHKPIWIGESWNDETKTTSSSKNDDFEDALVWAQRLGVAARMGTQVILHSTKPNELQYPNHQYWVSLLHKKLAGVVVLDTRLSGGDGAKKDVQFFAHCTPHSIESWTSSVDKFPQGSFTVYAVNPTNNSVDTYLRVNSGYRNLFHEDPHKESTTTIIYQYSLTAERDEEYSQSCTGRTLLNGKLLEVDENGVLPHLTPNEIQINIHEDIRGRKAAKRTIERKFFSEKITSEPGKEKFILKRTMRGISGKSQLGLTLTVPPKSVTFWVLPPSIGVKPCLGEEDEAEEEGMLLGANYYHTSKLRGQTNQEDSDGEEGEEYRERQMMHKLNKEDGARVNNKERHKRQLGYLSHPTSNVEVPPCSHLLRRKNSLGIRGISSLRKGPRTKMLMDSFEEEDEFVKRHPKKKRKGKKHSKPAGPKVLAFNVGTEDENESRCAYEKGMVFLSEDVASSSKEGDDYDNESDEDQDYDYVEDDFGEDEVNIFESNVYQRRIIEADSDSILHRESNQIVSSGKMLVEPPTKEAGYEDHSLGDSYYHGPGDYFMEYRKLAESGRNNEESSRELFEAEFTTSTAADEEVKAKILIEDTHHGNGSDRKGKISPSKSPEKYSLVEEEAGDIKQKQKEDASLSRTYEEGNCLGSKEKSPSEPEDMKATSNDELEKGLKDTGTEGKEESKGETEDDKKEEAGGGTKEEDEKAKEEEGEEPRDVSKDNDKDSNGSIVDHKKYSDSEKEALWIALARDKNDNGSEDDSESDEKKNKLSSHNGPQWITMGESDPNLLSQPLAKAYKPWEMKGLTRKRRGDDNNSHSLDSGSISKDSHPSPYLQNGESSRYAVDAPLMGYGTWGTGGRVLSKRNCRRERRERKNEESIPKSKLRDKRLEEGISELVAPKDRLERDTSVSDRYSSKSSYSKEDDSESVAPINRLERDISVFETSSSESSYSDGDDSEPNDSHESQSEESTEDISEDNEEQEKVNISNCSSGKTYEDKNKSEDEEKHLKDWKSSGDYNGVDGDVLAELSHDGEEVHRLRRDPEDEEVRNSRDKAEHVTFFFGPISKRLSSPQRGEAKEKKTEGVDEEIGSIRNSADRVNYALIPISKQLASAQDENAGGGNGSYAEKVDLIDMVTKPPGENNAIGDPQNRADSNATNTAQDRYSQELSLIESRRLNRRRMEAERRRQMEAARRRAAEARRRALKDLKCRLEENRRKLQSGLEPTAGDIKVRDASSFSSVENMRKTFDDLRNALRTRRELKKARSLGEEPPKKSEKTDNKGKPKNKRKISKMSQKKRGKRDLKRFMPGYSNDAERHLVLRAANGDEQQDFARNSRYEAPRTDLVRGSSAETPSSAEEWPVDKRLTDSTVNEDHDFVELLAGGRDDKIEGTGNLWPETFHGPARSSPYFSIDTAKEYGSGSYGMLNNIFSSIPPCKHAKEMAEMTKSLNGDEKKHPRYEYQVGEKVRNTEENEDRRRKSHYMENPNSKYEDKSPERVTKSHYNARVDEMVEKESENREEEYKRNAGKRNERSAKRIREIPKKKERKTRMVHSYSYEVNGISGENGVLANKILKYEKDVTNDKENMHFYFLGGNKDKLKKEYKVDRDERKMYGVGKDEQLTISNMAEEDNGTNQNISKNETDVTNDFVPEFNEGEIKERSNSFISGIIKRMFDFLQFIGIMMK